MEKMELREFDIAYSLEGDGTPLVLIHGYPLDHSIWNPVIPLLTGSFQVIVPDLRGFGESGSTSRVYGMQDLASDLAEFLDGLRIDGAVLAGHSMGGYVALAFAKAFPARVRGLGLVASQVVADPPERKEGRYKTAAEVAEKGVDGVADAMAPKLTGDPALQASVRDLIRKQSPEGIIGALKAMAEREDSTDLIKKFQMPVVLVHGDADLLIPIDRAREVESAVLQARMVALKGVGHLPMMEAPKETAKALKHLV